MKTIFTTLLFPILLLSGCFKTNDSPLKPKPQPTPTLPAETHEGKNTIGFLLNGEIWLPEVPLGFGQPMYSVHYTKDLNHELHFFANRKINEKGIFDGIAIYAENVLH